MTSRDLRFIAVMIVMAVMWGAHVLAVHRNTLRVAALEARIMALDQHCDAVKELFVLEHGRQ